MPVSRLADLVETVVKVESPVHIDTIITRIFWASNTRLTQRNQGILLNAIEVVCKNGHAVKRGNFLWTPEMSEPPLRSRFVLIIDRLRDIKLVAPEEIEVAFLAALRTSFSMERNDALKNAALLLGFNRLTQKVRGDMELALNRCLDRGIIVAGDDGRLRFP